MTKFLFICAGILSLAILPACKEETKKTETTVTQPADAPASVEKKETTEEKQ